MCSRWVWIFLVMGCLTAMEQSVQAETPGASVSLQNGARFSSPDGSLVAVSAGTYRLETTDGNQLRLLADGQSEPLLLKAVPISFDIKIDRPTALFIPDEPDVSHLVLALPGGKGYDARTWTGEIRPRNVKEEGISREKLNAALAALVTAASSQSAESGEEIESRGGLLPLTLSKMSMSADLSVTWSLSVAGGGYGQPSKFWTYEVEVKNAGRDTAYDVVVELSMFDTNRSADISSRIPNSTVSVQCGGIQHSTADHKFCKASSLSVNQTFFITFKTSTFGTNARPDPPLFVQVMSAIPDPVLANNWVTNIAPGDMALYPSADLVVGLLGQIDPVGQLQIYELSVTNKGKDLAYNIVLAYAFTDGKPGTSIIRIDPHGAECASRDVAPGLPIISCTVVDLGVGTTAGATVALSNPGNVSRSSTAQVTSAVPDNNQVNNTVRITIAQGNLPQHSTTAPKVTGSTPSSAPTLTSPSGMVLSPASPSATPMILQPKGPAPGQQATSPPVVPMLSGKYRVVINGLRVIHETKDDMFQFDGKRDEVYVAAFVRRQSVPSLGTDFVTTTSQLLDHGFVRSKVHGDINGFQDHRVLAGTASELGGLRTSDTIPLNRDPALPSARPPSTTTFPLHVWEGTLNDTDALVIHPTLWEWDGLTGVYNHWSVEMGNKYVGQAVVKKATSNPLYTEYGQYIPYLPVGTPLLGGQGRPMLIDNISGHDHPIGMAAQGNGRFTVPDQFIVLTRAKLEALFASPSVIGGVPPVVIPVQFVDYGAGLEGNYTMYLRVDKVP
ncbi:MAG: hypothetical protein P0111_10585 [Nitrospira sp.]|nr:hypothetical protein [Nitrospira sp.]